MSSNLYKRLSPNNAALLLIDHQTGLTLGVETSEFTVLRNNALALTNLGKVFNLPFALANTHNKLHL